MPSFREGWQASPCQSCFWVTVKEVYGWGFRDLGCRVLGIGVLRFQGSRVQEFKLNYDTGDAAICNNKYGSPAMVT